MAKKQKPPLVFCQRTEDFESAVQNYASALQEAAHTLGDHGLSKEEFWRTGIFRGAVEQIRGTQSATMAVKKNFMSAILEYLKAKNVIEAWNFSGSGERHDYEIKMNGGWNSIIETKGCLDGNNTNIFERPPHADEFLIWSLCQNPASDPRKNAWSGIHTRLSAEVMHRRQKVDGVVIWDMLCGTPGRPCPKLAADPSKSTQVEDYNVPPPCLFLMPRSIPDARNNQDPPTLSLNDTPLMKALHDEFNGQASDVVDVSINARMKDANVQRKTVFCRDGEEFAQSKWTPLKRAN